VGITKLTLANNHPRGRTETRGQVTAGDDFGNRTPGWTVRSMGRWITDCIDHDVMDSGRITLIVTVWLLMDVID
jgi:hypothetical protein